jgi:hypothetical protein
MKMGLPRALRALACGTLLALVAAVPAGADTTTSSNWAGYAVHGKGARFTRVVGMWRQPSGGCAPGHAGYSAAWIGLGGYNSSSRALEQIGTEYDCSAAGHTVSSAWVEIVPAPSRTISMTVSPGDEMAASVTVHGHRVTLALDDVTSGQAFKQTRQIRSVVVSSAEWIVEAPSDCRSGCQTLPLANFGHTSFRLAEAAARSGHLGGILDRRWQATRIDLRPTGPHVALGDPAAAIAAVGEAVASTLSAAGTAFSVAYSTAVSSPPQTQPAFARRLAT